MKLYNEMFFCTLPQITKSFHYHSSRPQLIRFDPVELLLLLSMEKSYLELPRNQKHLEKGNGEREKYEIARPTKRTTPFSRNIEFTLQNQF